MSTAKAKSIPAALSSKKPTTRRKAPVKAIEVLRVDTLAEVPWLVHGFSTRPGGFSKVYGGNALNLGITKSDAREAVERNREAFLRELGTTGWPLVQMHQVHSDVVHHVLSVDAERVRTALPTPAETTGAQTQGKPVLTGDGLVTDAPGILLTVKTADCMPVIIVDLKKHAVGVFHAGWRGTLRRIAQKGVGEMRRWFGSRPQDLQAALGPSIRSCCYSIGDEVRDAFSSQFAYADDLFREWQTYEDIHLKYPLLFLTARAPGHSELPKKTFLDLAEANRRQLRDAGIPERNITILPGCTACDTQRFFSHRKENGNTGRMMAVVGIRPI